MLSPESDLHNAVAVGGRRPEVVPKAAVPVVPSTSGGGRENRRFLMRALRNRLEKIAGSQPRFQRGQDPAKRTCGTASPRLPLDYLGYVLQTGRPGGLPRTKNSRWKTKRSLPCFFCHSCGSRNPYIPMKYWIPAFAGMTSGLAIEHGRALFQQPANAVPMLWWGGLRIAPRDGGLPSGLKTRRAQHRVNLIRGQDTRSL